ncbi:MAG: class I SAM-dependent methyltransferase [Parcubacteria group bacterium]|nr:class I SAM-dependent methyltransferase [Parcubacteria group bacterium]
MNTKNEKTSWGKFAGWYHRMIEERGGYQKEVILPNLLRILNVKKGEMILDLACGQGFFTREFFKKGAQVAGADVSEELIKIARKNSPREIRYEIAPADDLKFLKNGSVDKITIVLAIQNIENPRSVFAECGRILKPAGELFLVTNHPAFRVPKESEWGFDDKNKIQYRRINRYLSESKVKIQMSPGDRPEEHSLSFHRPLQFYFKALRGAGFCVGGLEEWVSNRKSEPGPRAAAENRARKEIPLFLFIKAQKLNL